VSDYTLHCGDVMAVLKGMEAESVHCCVTSPPYWGLRNYGIPDTAWPDGWRWEQHRVKAGNQGGRDKEAWRQETGQQGHDKDGNFLNDAVWQPCPGCPKCDLNDGLVLRRGSWRPTTAHEYVFMLTKSECYYSDGDAVRELHKHSKVTHQSQTIPDGASEAFMGHPPTNLGRCGNNPSGRNLRSVWEIPTHAFPDAHFATFPPRLVEPCIKSSTSEAGVCPICGAQWARVTEDSSTPHDGKTTSAYGAGSAANRLALARQAARKRGDEYQKQTQTLGWRPTCEHSADPVPATILDPFCGSGTAGLVALRLGRDFVGLDIKQEYLDMADRRLRPVADQGRLRL